MDEDLPEGWRLIRRDGRIFAVHTCHGWTDVHPDTEEGLAAVEDKARRADRFARQVDPVRGGPRHHHHPRP